MAKYVHIVQIHPVSYGKVNLNQVMVEREFKTKKEALVYAQEKNMSILNIHTLAIYHGRVNVATGV